jgi:hypothetical protein
MSVHLVADGLVARIDPLNTGIGTPDLFHGELRTFGSDRPVKDKTTGGYPWSLGPTEEHVLDALTKRAQAITDQQVVKDAAL